MQQVLPMPLSLKARLDLVSQSRLPQLKKTQDFNLSCDPKSKIPEYNSLFDNNLQRYFRNNKVQKVLVYNGVIDTEGRLVRNRRDMHRRSVEKLPSVGYGTPLDSPAKSMRDPYIETPVRTIRDSYRDSKESQVTDNRTQNSAQGNYRSPVNQSKSHQKLNPVPRGARTQSVGLIDMKQSSRSPTPEKVYLQHRKEKDWKMKEARFAKARIVASRTQSGAQTLRPITSQELKGIFEKYKNKVQEPVIKVEDSESAIAEKTMENEEESPKQKHEISEKKQEEKEIEKVEKVEKESEKQESEGGEKEDEEIKRVETKYLEEEDDEDEKS